MKQFIPAHKRLITLLAISGICLLGWFIFVHHLDFDSMWWDEHYTWRISRDGPLSVIEETNKDVHPPFGYFWAWAWMTWMGGSDSLFIIRLSSAIAGILAVAVTYHVGKNWFKSAWAGAGAALFMLTAGIFIFYTRILRMYTPITLLAALSWLTLQRLLEGKSKSGWGYAASLALMAYTHYTSVFIIVPQFVVVLLFYRHHLRRVLLAYACAFLAFVPWIPSFWNQMAVARAQRAVPDAIIAGPLPGQTASLGQIAEFWDVYTNQQTAFVLLLVVLAAFMGFNRAASPRFRRWLTAALLWFFLTITAIMAFSLIVPTYGLRFVITVLPGLALIVGAAVYLLPGTWPRLATLAVIALTGILSHPYTFDTITIIPPYRQLLEAVAEDFQPGDKIWYNLSYGARGSSLQLSAGYHLAHDIPELKPEDFVWAAPRDFADVAETPRVWDVRPYWIPMLADVQPVLEQGRTVTLEQSIRGYNVRLYEAPRRDLPAYDFGNLFEALISPLDDTEYQPGSRIQVKSWWRALQFSDRDYSYGLYLRAKSDGAFVGQSDGGLLSGGAPTSQWQPVESFALTLLGLDVPPNLPAGEYDLLLGLYYWEDPARLPVSTVVNGAGDNIDAGLALLRVATISLP